MLRTLQRIVLLGALGVAACVPGKGAPPEDVFVAAPPSAGQLYAEQTCASCHAVGAGQKESPNPMAPTFTSIADTPGMTRMALAAWLHSVHETMPSLIVDSAHIDDLSDYIASLKSRDMPRPPADPKK
jgi:mono/diheme cytochrome c family protein